MIAMLLASLAFLALPAGPDPLPQQFLGWYEADPKDCGHDFATRDDDETAQGGAMLLVRKRELHFVQWDWPIRAMKPLDARTVAVERIDRDPDTRRIRILPMTLKLEGSLLVMIQNDGTSRYHRCKGRTV